MENNYIIRDASFESASVFAAGSPYILAVVVSSMPTVSLPPVAEYYVPGPFPAPLHLMVHEILHRYQL